MNAGAAWGWISRTREIARPRRCGRWRIEASVTPTAKTSAVDSAAKATVQTKSRSSGSRTPREVSTRSKSASPASTRQPGASALPSSSRKDPRPGRA